MPITIQGSRNGCALQGVLKAVKAVAGFIPIIHSSLGCGLQGSMEGGLISDLIGSHDIYGFEVPSTNVSEKQVIFGGTSRLREQIKNTVKVLKGDLYLVVSGCATQIIGDDIPAMTKEAQEQGYPVIYINAPGFKGDMHEGYKLLFKGIIEQLPVVYKETLAKTPKLINLLGILPGQDAFFEGDLSELQRTLEMIGLTANQLFGIEGNLSSWRQLQNAELNIVFSPWGRDIAEYLEQKFDTPFLDFGALPVGVEETAKVICAVSKKLKLDLDFTETLIKAQEKNLVYNLRKIANLYFKHDFQKEFVIVGESSKAPGILKFLHKTLGLIGRGLVITDNPIESYRSRLIDEIAQFSYGDKIELLFSEDSGEINDFIKEINPELILGSFIEESVAYDLGVPLFQVSHPIKDKIVLTKSYIGFNGAIRLVEDLGSALIKK